VRLYLVRHGAVTVREEQPSAQWHLSAEGRAAVESLAGEPFWASLAIVYSSPEPKAVATAQRLAGPHKLALRIERDLREVERPWVAEGYEDVARRYLDGEAIAGWEARADALDRVRKCIDGIVAQGEDTAVVSHGLALTLYLQDMLDLDAEASNALWRSIRFPDVAIVDPQARTLEREFGATGG
jgi:broad specificity phosphatase PhoE